MGTNTHGEQVLVEVRLKALREERDALVGAISWMDEPDLICDVLRTLRELEGEIARLTKCGTGRP